LTCQNGMTPLLRACFSGNFFVTKLLIELKANHTCRDTVRIIVEFLLMVEFLTCTILSSLETLFWIGLV
jgi:hypothetical protein